MKSRNRVVASVVASLDNCVLTTAYLQPIRRQTNVTTAHAHSLTRSSHTNTAACIDWPARLLAVRRGEGVGGSTGRTRWK